MSIRCCPLTLPTTAQKIAVSANTLALNRDGKHTGVTTVSAGTLLINGDWSSATTVATAGTFDLLDWSKLALAGGNYSTLTLTIIPEPSVWVLLDTGISLLTVLRLRRAKC